MSATRNGQIGVLVIVAGLLLALAAVAVSFDTPGTLNPVEQPTDDEGNVIDRCDVESTITIKATALSGVNILEDTFAFRTEKSGFFSIGEANIQALSLLAAENVRVTASMTGPGLDGTVSRTVDVGSLSKLTEESKEIRFRVTKVPEGNYDFKYVVRSSEGVTDFSIKQGVTC